MMREGTEKSSRYGSGTGNSYSRGYSSRRGRGDVSRYESRRGRRRSRIESFETAEPENPLESLSNLSDVMLVFACGLMVALIINLNVDVSRLSEAVVRYKDDSESAEVEKRDGAGMEEIGKVYRDPETGKTYIVDKGEDGYDEDE